MRGRTTIFISHQGLDRAYADRIAVLYGGRIVELGTHDELIRAERYYTDLYQDSNLRKERTGGGLTRRFSIGNGQLRIG